MVAVHQIVIIGASFGGIPVAHGLLKDVLPTLSAGGKHAYKVTLISTSDHFYWKIGAPRLIVNPKSLPVEKALLPIADGFKSYSPEQYQFIKAAVESIQPETKTLELNNGSTVNYDSLVIASGTSFNSDVWSATNGEGQLAAALKDLQGRIPAAQSILVAGGGAAGTETAGELGEVFGGKKEITILSGSTGLLSRLHNKKVGADAEGRLKKMGVTVIHRVKVNSWKHEGGKDVLQLSDGTTKTVDVYIEATGDRPNNQFVPQRWLSEKGYVKTDGQTLRLNEAGVTGVYCIGSVASYSDGSVLDTKFSLKAILESIKLDLQGGAPGPRSKNVYKKITSDMQFVPLGSTQGVGVVMGWKIPSFLVKMAKSKDFMIGNAPKLVAGTA
jgi:NADH dehydrogenase FAD-containing subunit